MGASGQEVLCSNCGEKAATNHICDGRTGASTDLCDECTTNLNPIAAYSANQIKDAKCRYCGGSPCAGGHDTLSQIIGGPIEERWMCMPCSTEYYSVALSGFEKVSDELAPEQQILRMKKISEDAEAHMFAYVRQRDS